MSPSEHLTASLAIWRMATDKNSLAIQRCLEEVSGLSLGSFAKIRGHDIIKMNIEMFVQ